MVACRAPQVKAIGIGGVAFVIPVPLETDAGTISRMIVLVLVKRELMDLGYTNKRVWVILMRDWVILMRGTGLY